MSRMNLAENENYRTSVKKQLPCLIRNGFLVIFSGLIISTVIFFLEWNEALFLLPIVLFVFGLIALIAAWHIRQGLIDVGFVRLVFGIISKLKKLKQ